MKNSILIALFLFTFVACKNQEAPKQEQQAMPKEGSATAVPMKTDTM